MRLNFTPLVLVSTVFAASTEHQKLKRVLGLTKPNGYIVKMKDGAPRQDSIASLTALASALGLKSSDDYKIGYSDWTRK